MSPNQTMPLNTDAPNWKERREFANTACQRPLFRSHHAR